MDLLKTKTRGSDKNRKKEQIGEPVPMSPQIARKGGKEADAREVAMAHPLMPICDVRGPSEYLVLLVKGTELVEKFDSEANHIYTMAMNWMKDMRSFLATSSNSVNSSTHFDEALKVMKILGKALKVRDLARKDLDMLISQYIEALVKERDEAVSMVERTRNAMPVPVPRSDVGVQIDPQLYRVEEVEEHQQREEKKRKKIPSLEEDKAQRKRKNITQSREKEYFMAKQDSGIFEEKQGLPESLQQDQTTPQRNQNQKYKASITNEGQSSGEPPQELLKQVEAMQQLLLQLRARFLLLKDNQKATEKYKTMVQERRAKRRQQRQQHKQKQKFQKKLLDMLYMPV